MLSSTVVLFVFIGLFSFSLGVFLKGFLLNYSHNKKSKRVAKFWIDKIDREQLQGDKNHAYQMVLEYARLHKSLQKDIVDEALLIKTVERKSQVLSDLIDHGMECNKREECAKQEVEPGALSV